MMSKKKKKKSSNGKVLTLAEVMAAQNEVCGPGTMFRGSGMKKDPMRIPTGVFAVDFATAGGLPLWGTTCFWGGDGGGKSNLCLNVVKAAQSICWRCMKPFKFCECDSPLEMFVYYADVEGTVEGTLDRDWASAIGADPEKYVVGLADYGEQHVNIADEALKATDCGLVIIDSLAALIPTTEMDAPLEDKFIAEQARLITRMVRKLKQRLIRERKKGHPCSVLFTNQLRIKIGQMFGDPETMPGGHGLRHEFSLLLRCVQKALKKEGADAKFWDASRSKKTGQRFSFSIKKEKVLTLSGVGEYVRVLEDLPDVGLKAGMVDDFATVMKYARDFGIVVKDKGKWSFRGKYKASRLDEIRQLWMSDWDEYLWTQQEIIARAKERVRGGKDSM